MKQAQSRSGPSEQGELMIEARAETCPEYALGEVEPDLIHVVELERGKVEARFALTLSGVANTRHDRERGDPREELLNSQSRIRALLTNLGSEQEVRFGYRWRCGRERLPEFELSISGTSRGTAGDQVLASARDLVSSLRATLVSRQIGLTFSSRQSGKAPADVPTRTYVIEPVTISIPTASMRAIGFSSALTDAQDVILSLPPVDSSSPFDSVLQAGIDGSFEFMVSVSIESFSLSDEALGVVAGALKNLRSGNNGPLRYRRSESDGVIADKVVNATEKQLESWLAENRGFRVKCKVAANQDLPESLLELLGIELFGGAPLTIRKLDKRIITPEAHRANFDSVDLSGCFRREDQALSLLPRREALRDIGVPTVYPMIPVNLPTQGLTLGRCRHGMTARPVRLAEAYRSRHCYVIGATGTGKSTLLQNMLAQDIRAGRGVCLIDPHGDLFSQVLQDIPEQRAGDVVLIDLADHRHSIGLNFLECAGPGKDLQMNFIVNELMSIFHRMYNMDIAGGPAFETYMRNALLAVMGNVKRPATLLDVVRFFEDKSYRESIKTSSSNKLAVSFWDRQAEKVNGEWAFHNFAPYVTSKLNQFTHNAIIRPIIGQARSTVDFQAAMDSEQIILVNLAKGLLGEFDARLLGMLLIGKLFNAALARSSFGSLPGKPFHLYIDEFQNLATPTVIALLSEARKFGLSLTMANQHLGQLMEHDKQKGISDAILGNVASMLFFRMGPKDAEILESYTKPYINAHDLQQLPDHHIACRLLNDNAPLPTFVFETLPAPACEPADASRTALTERIRHQSRQRHTRLRSRVESSIMKSWMSKDD